MPDHFFFDENGFLQPSKPIRADLEFLKENFVAPFPGSATRPFLFENYRRFVADLQHEVFPYFEQWVDGSFVSLKPDPKDLDVVTFIDWQVFKMRESVIDRYQSYNLEKQGIDAYFVPIYPENHPDWHKTARFYDHWHQIFGKTRPAFNGKREPKGYLKLFFEK